MGRMLFENMPLFGGLLLFGLLCLGWMWRRGVVRGWMLLVWIFSGGVLMVTGLSTPTSYEQAEEFARRMQVKFENRTISDVLSMVSVSRSEALVGAGLLEGLLGSGWSACRLRELEVSLWGLEKAREGGMELVIAVEGWVSLERDALRFGRLYWGLRFEKRGWGRGWGLVRVGFLGRVPPRERKASMISLGGAH